MINEDLLEYIPSTTFTGTRTVMLISDLPQANEVKLGRGYSSQASRMDFQALEAAGIPTRDMFSTYVVNFRPPSGDLSTLFWKKGLPVEGYRSFGGTTDKTCLILDYVYDELVRLREEIKRVQPSVLILYGRYALYFLTGETKQLETHKSTYGALLKWRASSLQLSSWWQFEKTHVAIPTLPLNCTYTLPDKQFLVKPDLKRIKRQIDESKHGDLSQYTSRKVSYEILSNAGTEEDFKTVTSRLLWLLSKAEQEVLPLATDVETIAYAYIDCFTIAWSSSDAICIPFECKERAHYWTVAQEEYLHTLIRALFLHPNVRHYGQNYIYDVQYYLRNLCVYVKAEHDSQVMNHTLYSVMEKRLDFLSSYYCKVHKYWKGNGKIDRKTKKRPENRERWTYNCDDGTITFEVVQALLREYTGANKKLNEAYRFQMYEVTPAVTRMMLHGIRIDTSTRDRNILLLEAEAEQLAKRFNHAMMTDCNLKSSQQMQSIFYDLFKCPKTYKRTIDANGIEKNTPTLDEDVLHDLWDTQPLLRGLIDILLDYKKLTKTAASLAGLTLDIDDRLRCQYGVCGTDTYRFNSKANAFGTGNNLQVLSKGDKLRNGRKLPNTKEIILPDEGCVFFDIDLSAADARIVAAISRCTELLDILESGEDLYVMLLREYYRDKSIDKKDYRRQTFKMITHGCLTGEHEVLTCTGWKSLEEVCDSAETIAVWDKDTWSISFETPSKWYSNTLQEGEKLVCFEGNALSQITTVDHKLPYTVDSSENLRVGIAGNLPKSARVPYTGFYVGGTSLVKPSFIQLLVALQADGNVQCTDKEGVSTFRWHFKKERKADRLITILQDLNIDFNCKRPEETSDNSFRIWFKGYLEPYMKKAGSWLLTYSVKALKLWIDEQLFWDGTVDNSDSSRVRDCMFTVDKNSAEWVHTIAHLVGYGSLLTETVRDDTRQTLYTVSFNQRKFHSCASGTKKYLEGEGIKIYCPTTSTGFFLVRHKGKISVTGNSNYMGKAAGLAARSGLNFADVERLQKYYFGRFPEIPRWHQELEQQVMGRGWIENVFGYRRYFFDKRAATIMNVAAAWNPQSTVGLLINHGLCSVMKELPEVKVQMQTHDSFAGSFPKEKMWLKEEIVKRCLIPLPYERPMTIPVNIGTSEVSWGSID